MGTNWNAGGSLCISETRFFACEGDQILAQLAQGDCAVSILGDIQGSGPGLLVLGSPA